MPNARVNKLPEEKLPAPEEPNFSGSAAPDVVACERTLDHQDTEFPLPAPDHIDSCIQDLEIRSVRLGPACLIPSRILHE